MNRTLPLASLAAIALATLSAPAEAYIGPGAGISLLGAFWALILAVFAAVSVVVWYPIRNLLRSRRSSARRHEQNTVRTEVGEERRHPA